MRCQNLYNLRCHNVFIRTIIIIFKYNWKIPPGDVFFNPIFRSFYDAAISVVKEYFHTYSSSLGNIFVLLFIQSAKLGKQQRPDT